jgi:hypothetical protein
VNCAWSVVAGLCGCIVAMPASRQAACVSPAACSACGHMQALSCQQKTGHFAHYKLFVLQPLPLCYCHARSHTVRIPPTNQHGLRLSFAPRTTPPVAEMGPLSFLIAPHSCVLCSPISPHRPQSVCPRTFFPLSVDCSLNVLVLLHPHALPCVSTRNTVHTCAELGRPAGRILCRGRVRVKWFDYAPCPNRSAVWPAVWR